MTEGSQPMFSRTRLLGLDIVTVTAPDIIEKVNASGEVARMAVSGPTLEKLPWVFRWFFSMSRFFNVTLNGWFLPFRTTDDATYAPCRAYLDGKFAADRDMSDHVSEAVDFLMTGDPTDRELSDVTIRAVWQYIVPEGHPPIPEHVLQAVQSQVGDVTEAFIPWKVLAGKRAASTIYQFADDTMTEIGDRANLPNEVVTDVAHVFFAVQKNAPILLRGIAENPDQDPKLTLSNIGTVKDIPRLCIKTGTLDGLLPEDDPAVENKTVVLLGLREAARASKSLDYVFASGRDERRCSAEHVLLQFFQGVRDELLKRKTG